MRFKARERLKGMIQIQRSDKLANLIYDGIIPSCKRFNVVIFPGYKFIAEMRRKYPRFGITEEQKRINYFRRIRWEDLPPITIYLDDFEQAETL